MKSFHLVRGLLVTVLATASACSGQGSEQFGGSGSELLASGPVTFTVNLPPGTPLSSVALASKSTILLGNRVTVSTEGAPSAQSAIVNSGTGTTAVQTDAVLTSDIWSRGSVFLGSRTQVAGSVTSGGPITQQSGVTIGGVTLENQTLTSVPTSWTVNFPASSMNIILQPGQTATRSPGAFATVSIATNATLTLSSGTYYFDQLNTEPNGRILLQGAGPFIFNVKTSFTAKGQIVLPAGTPPASLVVNVAGTSDVFLQAQFDGTLFAPEANVTLAQIGTASYHGAFFGKSLTLQADVKVLHRGIPGTSVAPVAECVIPQADGSYKAVFGYQSSSLFGDITIPVGANNAFSPGSNNRGQPTTFKPGRKTAQFIVPFDGRALTWSLGGVGTTASALLPQCTPACVQQLVDPTKPRIDTVLTTPAAPLSTAESAAMRDSFRWRDSLPLPELLPNGDPRLYYGLIYLTSPASVQMLDAMRIHYSSIPMFETDMASLEGQGIQNDFFYQHDGRGQFVYALMPAAAYNEVRKAALDPVEPVEIFRALPLKEIPTNDSGIVTRTSCGLAPIAQCVAQAANGSLRAVFSYNNPAGGPVTVPIGAENAVTGGPAGTVPPEAFAAGQHTAVFAVPIASGATIRWALNGQTVSLSASAPRCSAAIVAQIGVDTFNPFPTPAPTSCRYPTPAEVRNPASRLPPAARFNTCQSVSYTFAGTLGLKWRGFDDDAEDAAGLAADAALDLGESLLMSVAASSSTRINDDTTTVRSALFGKLIRKAARAVSRAVKGAVDGIRRGLRNVAGFFLGQQTVTVTIDPLNTDPNFSGTLQQAWGGEFGKAMSLQGIQLRANRSVFLSVHDLDANNTTDDIRVVRHLDGARLCFVNDNGAGRIIPGLVPITTCLDSSANINVNGPYLRHVSSKHMNMMAQMTDVHRYLHDVGAGDTKKAEVITGLPANAIGVLNGNRPFAPCFAFSWMNDVATFMTVLGFVAADQLNQLMDPAIRAAANGMLRGVDTAITNLNNAAADAATVVAQTANTQLQQLAQDTSNAITNAINASQEARRQATLLAQAADDYANAVDTAARFRADNHPAAQAAADMAQRAADELNVRVAAAQAALIAAETAAAVARSFVDQLAAALPSNPQIADAVNRMRQLVNGATEQFTRIASTAVDVAIKVKDVLVTGQIVWITTAIGRTIGEYFEMLAGGDIIFPEGTDNENMRSRGVITHEYGHYTLCNLLNSISPSKFAAVYDEAAAAGLLTGQSPNATGAVMNEAFADFITSQVAGGTNYAVWPNSVDVGQGNPDPNMSYCLASNSDCIEHNFTNADADDFEEKVRRNISLFSDAFDGGPGAVADSPGNANPWLATSPITQSPTPGPAADDEAIKLNGAGLRSWIRFAMDRGGAIPVLREDNVFGGLNDAMVACGNWCARCELFRNHTVDAPTGLPTCPVAWVGPRPTMTANNVTTTVACTWESSCLGMTPDPATRMCIPSCPPGEVFDTCQLKCVPNIVK
jgi:hypothetical protein